MAAVRNVTKRERAEEMLRENEERFRSLAQNPSDTIMILRTDGIMHYQNPSVEQVLDHRP